MSIIIDDLNARGMNPRKVSGTHGGEYHSPCPGCGGEDRFHCWPDQGEDGTWWCRGCNKGGDAIQYLIDYCGKNFKDAAAAVGRAVDDIPRRPVTPRQRRKQPFVPSIPDEPTNIWIEKSGKLVEWAHEILLGNDSMMEYLAGRGISERTVCKYKLGYNPGENGKNAIFRARSAWGLPEERRENGKLKPLWIPRGIVIPKIINGDIHRIRIRREKSDLTPEFIFPYYVLPGSSSSTLVAGDSSKAFVIVEAELDALACAEAAGDLCMAAAMGSSSTKPDATSYALLKKALCILNALDFDSAGEKAWRWWRDNFSKSKRWPVPSGKDPGDAFLNGVNLRAWILAGLPPVFRMVGSTVLDGEDFEDGVGKSVPVEEKVNGKVEADIPDNILTIAKWFNEYPIRIIKDARRIRYHENRLWASKNVEMSRRINMSVFFDPTVMNHIENHPDRVITGENFIYDLRDIDLN